jgi:hypothetical protein
MSSWLVHHSVSTLLASDGLSSLHLGRRATVCTVSRRPSSVQTTQCESCRAPRPWSDEGRRGRGGRTSAKVRDILGGLLSHALRHRIGVLLRPLRLRHFVDEGVSLKREESMDRSRRRWTAREVGFESLREIVATQTCLIDPAYQPGLTMTWQCYDSGLERCKISEDHPTKVDHG